MIKPAFECPQHRHRPLLTRRPTIGVVHGPDLLFDAVGSIDELRGRNVARNRGVATTGTAGVLVMAKRRGEIRAVKPLIEEMGMRGYRFSEKLVRDVLGICGELRETLESRGLSWTRWGGAALTAAEMFALRVQADMYRLAFLNRVTTVATLGSRATRKCTSDVALPHISVAATTSSAYAFSLWRNTSLVSGCRSRLGFWSRCTSDIVG